MKHINFITNLDPHDVSGGGSGVNSATYQVLCDHFKVRYIGPINPPVDYRAKLVSKMRRMVDLPGNFHFFSQRRLDSIARLIERRVDVNADGDFFHGSTPWIHYNNPRPFYIYSDACFSTYIDVYHKRRQFFEEDLKRICNAEASWLASARRVFYRTQWALEQAVNAYSLPRDNLTVVGVGGHISIPESDTYQGDLNFVFIAHNFEQKGGGICLGAFRLVREAFPEARLIIVGGRPPESVIREPGISYLGFLRKTVPEELHKLESLLSKAFALIHPTSSDTNPLVLTEAGYFGCPSIATNSFGIPELIRHGITGYLVDPPLQPESFAQRMLELCQDSSKYYIMRRAVRLYTTAYLTWQKVGERIIDRINDS